MYNRLRIIYNKGGNQVKSLKINIIILLRLYMNFVIEQIAFNKLIKQL